MEIERKLADLLVSTGVIKPSQLEEAAEIAKSNGEPLPEVLVAQGWITTADLVEFYETLSEVLPMLSPDAAIIELIPEDLMRRHQVFPLLMEGGQLVLAMADPLNVDAADDVRLASGCRRINPLYVPRELVDRAIERLFGGALLDRLVESCRPDEEVGGNAKGGRYQSVEAVVGEGPVARLMQTLIIQAVQRDATDIHLEPGRDGLRVRFRIDGILQPVRDVSVGVSTPLIARLKIMAELDISEKRLPQDGRVQVQVGSREVDLRVSTIRTVYGEKAVVRLLDRSRLLLGLDELGLSGTCLQTMREMIRDPYGMFLVTGPTGSGKTTTLYAILQELNTPGVNIVTIEDPVEYILKGANQIQISRKVGLDFARSLRSVLRQDPEVIMVGEIRDVETAKIAARAAITGHMVFSTMHTNDAAGALTRLTDMEVEPFMVASSVLAVLAQRLVRVVCPHCREPYVPEADSRERFFMGTHYSDSNPIFRAVGCDHCDGSGYRGRVAVAELLVVNSVLRDLVCRKVPLATLHGAARSAGMVSLVDDGFAKISQGITTLSELMRIRHSNV
ncbi:MAG: ATPase, T2SS/T4P/T4SS family [Eubacteriales bacterium]|jgi:type IV pilus assembly protein PilB|nr:Flp pilus assembly complex ATPase component TadA [Bacillota bacterium]MBV1727242.1 Flp pilus assembly complex ATPase component TadA [Desulforudis sp.]MDQ7788492.1 ATPase, T2SS/T4P/T4SS family [Clostridia bacterium]MDZ4043174.1 ATPase, T2SS/T4P/T4SS family [Eubacteriales bacterium]MBU4532115.1 Flp pilus assembly complex ATPase component TadA [Bacillota bacterium]